MIINKIFILYFALLTVADSDYALDPTNMSTRRKFIDIGANLADQMFQGIYNKQTPKHPPDLENVLQRAFDAGLEKIIITGTNLEASQKAIELSQTDDRLFATVGVHPTHCNDFLQNDCEIYSNSLRELIKNNSNKVVSFGEIGLDYDRLMFCSKEDQKKYFIHQLDISKEFELPLFLHMRSCEEDFLPYLEQRKGNIRGVVHSFDGNTDAMHRIIDVGLYIGINGCSLKTEDNLSNVRHIPKDRLLIETDSPWCEIKPSHAGYKYIKTKLPAIKKEKWEKDKLVKGRNEPCNIIQVLEVLAAVREEDPDELADQIFKNTEDLFFSKFK